MPIKVFVRTTQPDVISTIVTKSGVKKLRAIHKSKWLSERGIYVNDCLDHPKGSPVVSVDLYGFNPDDESGTFLRTAKVCIFCWKVLEKLP